jgi:transposase-like protein
MNKEKREVRITCPKCKRTFGVDQKAPVKYLERVLDQYEEYFKQIEKELLARKERMK